VTASPNSTPLTVAFGRRTRALRQQRGWSLERMAARPGLCIATVRRVERGDNVRLGTAEKVAAAFGMDLADMLGPEESG
jgi:transcriptional regulator with XRE-family HTH domain